MPTSGISKPVAANLGTAARLVANFWNRYREVRCWHLADIATLPNDRFAPAADIPQMQFLACNAPNSGKVLLLLIRDLHRQGELKRCTVG
jgi:hypothetical protein